MYFTTFNHYDDDVLYSNETKYADENCLICWDPPTINNNIIRMKSLVHHLSFLKTCSCNGYFHHDCLLKWIDTTDSCPICRKEIEKNVTNSNNILYLNKNSQLFRIIYFTNNYNYAYTIFNYFFIFFVLKLIYYIMLDIQLFIEKNNDYDQCSVN